MTYCLAIKVNDGLVFAGDTRTAAGVDDVRVYNKLHTFEFPDERILLLLSAGNLATTQAVLAQIQRDLENPQPAMSLRIARRMYDAAEYIGHLSTQAQKQVLAEAGPTTVDFRTTMIIGGQIQGEEPMLYLVYPEGNCISASEGTPYLQIGEHKYGKPILDRIIRSNTSLEDAARCALVSLDSTMKSNISVGPPLDLAIVRNGELRISQQLRLDLDMPFYARLKESWGKNLEAVFTNLPRFEWELAAANQQNIPFAQQAQQQQQ
jgi:putative proteasome-type protease